MTRILILSSNARRDLNLERELADLIETLQDNNHFVVRIALGVTPQQLQTLFLRHEPQIVHFCGHGAGEQGLVLQNDEGREQLVSTETLSALFRNFATAIDCAVLNACSSDYQASAIVKYINYAVGMSQEILDKAAYIFAVGFYEGLRYRKPIAEAYELGRLAIQIAFERRNEPFNRLTIRSDSSQTSRKLGPVNSSAQTTLPEHLIPILRKKITLLASSISPNRPPGFDDVIKKAINLKKYKDDAREVYDNFGQVSPNTKILWEKQELEQRNLVLDKVKKSWIQGVLEPSLNEAPEINLGMRYRDSQDATYYSSNSIEALSVDLRQSHETLKQTRLYREMGQGRTLLILGEPGAGKTVSLLQLAKRLIEHCEENPKLPIPIVFNLSSWANNPQQRIFDWLVKELKEKYYINEPLGKDWVKNKKIILLLDGLDEVKKEEREDCVRALNSFINSYPSNEIAVCSRLQDYEALHERLQISIAICIQPLSLEQVRQFLQQAPGNLNNLSSLLETDSKLQNLAKTPLILHTMIQAYRGKSLEELNNAVLYHNENEIKKHLFESYINFRFGQESTPEYSLRQVGRWLSFLAKQMVREQQTIFLIEKMQHNWLQDQTRKIIYSLVTVLIAALILLLLVGGLNLLIPDQQIPFSNLLAWMLILAVTLLLKPLEILRFETLIFPGKKDLDILVKELIDGLKTGLILSLILSTVAFLLQNYIEITPIAKMMSIADPKGQCYGIEFTTITACLFIPSVKWGLGLGLTLGLINGTRGSEIQEKAKPNQGIWESRNNSLILVLISWIFLVIVFKMIDIIPGLSAGQSLFKLIVTGLRWALILVVVFGPGQTCIRHFTLRLILCMEKCIPWNYARFLNFASERSLLRKVGGGYIFFHRMLLEHFAQL